MKKARPAFSPGDLIRMDFDPQAGHEQGGWRPALVVSELGYNRQSGLTLVCPITSQVKGYPFEVALPEGAPFQGVVLADQVKSLDLVARHAKKAGTAPAGVLATVRAFLALILGVK